VEQPSKLEYFESVSRWLLAVFIIGLWAWLAWNGKGDAQTLAAMVVGFYFGNATATVGLRTTLRALSLK
jgi:hypothetical protein